MSRHKKPDAGATRRAIYLSSITERHFNTLINAAAVFLFAALGAAFGHAVDGMAADLTAGPPAAVDQGGLAHER